MWYSLPFLNWQLRHRKHPLNNCHVKNTVKYKSKPQLDITIFLSVTGLPNPWLPLYSKPVWRYKLKLVVLDTLRALFVLIPLTPQSPHLFPIWNVSRFDEKAKPRCTTTVRHCLSRKNACSHGLGGTAAHKHRARGWLFLGQRRYLRSFCHHLRA